jgi:hypothetical protein
MEYGGQSGEDFVGSNSGDRAIHGRNEKCMNNFGREIYSPDLY